MKQVLFVRPDSSEDGNILWCESGSEQVESRRGWQALSELAEHPLAARVCLLLPASEMIFRHFTLPKKSLSAQATPFSWLAEDTLMGDVDALHWTVLNKKGREVDAVAIDGGRLEHWLTLCADAGLTVVQALPDAILLPATTGGCTLAELDGSYWLRFASFSAGEADAALLPLLNPQGDGEICCYGEAPPGMVVDELLPWQHPMVLIQPQWKTCRASLLHGAFALNGGRAGGFRHARTFLSVMALLSVGLLVAPRAVVAWELVQQENQAQQEMVELAQHYFPSLRQTTNLKYHFGQNIKKVKKGVFLQTQLLEQIKQSVPGLEIAEVDYDETQNQLTLNLSAMQQQTLQEFVTRASDSFDFALQPVSAEAPYTAIVTGKQK